MESTDHVIFELDDGRVVKRLGHCSSCGWCCEVVGRAVVNHDNDVEFGRIRNLPRVFDIVSVCPKLTEDKKCSIYENRPRTCKEFPTHPDQIVDSPCTYWFEEV